jgi:hypothetical protein
VLLPGGCQPPGEVRAIERLVTTMGGRGERSLPKPLHHGMTLFPPAVPLHQRCLRMLWSGSCTDIAHAERYMQLLKEAKVKGYMFEQQNYMSKQQ